ncbi:hypothetical protein FJTKL_00133 [Diaporthe vaccinii]|uniref:Uncharacterized protein n=1 Tax=Diaporthe vaccinii TaxID=105482 RepID=A0ABR4E4F3_9PEZI
MIVVHNDKCCASRHVGSKPLMLVNDFRKRPSVFKPCSSAPQSKCRTPCSLQSVRRFLRWSPVALHIAMRGYSQKTKRPRQEK